MTCRMGDMRNKEVININDGERIGFVSDIELDTGTATLVSLVIYGKLRIFGLLGRQPDIVIPWGDITLIGSDTVLVNYKPPEYNEKENKIMKILDKLSL